MLHWREFSAWITIDGVEAPEYDVETSQDEKTVTCWIASELGKKFSVCWRNTSYRHDTSGGIKMDGNPCGGLVVYGRTVPKNAKKEGVVDRLTVRPFVFSSLTLTDDDTFLGGATQHQDLGVIELAITPIHIVGQGAAASNKSLASLKVHERSKKAVTQQITLAKAEPLSAPQSFVSSKRAGPDLVKFVFKYRPLDILQANGIAPQLKRNASPTRPPTPDSDGGEEEAKVLRETAALDAKRARTDKTVKKETKPRVKRESGAGDVIDLTDTPPSKRVKREEKLPFVSGEIIDLT
ncbi:hypothetical protein B0H10DRAFT_1987367 [Mycena sp. CBHHK59/15]|nr:hypothetical protein B0H10DRAFT_1987367 [Mycena sp. CBHHK59/15]